MTDSSATSDATAELRHQKFEQIRANELARGQSPDEAAATAAATVDKVLAQEGAASS